MRSHTAPPRPPIGWRLALLAAIGLFAGAGAWAQTQTPGAVLRRSAAPAEVDEGLVQLDFDDVELSVVIDTIAKLTRKNFIYDDRVRGRVTIISHERIPIDLAYAVFESALQMKGFTTVEGPGGATRIIPIRDAKESSIETSRSDQIPPFRDRYVTRLIPLEYIEAESITNTLKPLVSKDAAMFAYPPTNSIILTDSGTNIRRILDILDLIDVETYKENQALFKIRYADAGAMADMLNEIYGETTSSARTPTIRSSRARRAAATQATETPEAGQVKIITDQRTNSLIVLASRAQIDDIRRLITRLDVPIAGGGRIHVYYLKNADAEELAQTLNSLITGQPQSAAPARTTAGAAGVQAQALRSAVTELAEGVSVTADPATNSLVIRASAEGFATLSQVIEQLDIPRPQVLVEALIMEVDVTEMEDLGISWMLDLVKGNTRVTFQTSTANPDATFTGSAQQTSNATDNFFPVDPIEGITTPILLPETTFQALISAAASDSGTNILSAPHVLTSDNEEAEIKIGQNIPIITSRVQSAAGVTSSDSLATSVNVERQDIGVTLRVTPQISEGDTLRLQIFQEITDLSETQPTNIEDVGPILLSRKIENTVVVNDNDTVVIGGLISDVYQDGISKVPFVGDIPFLGWLFKSTSLSLRKINLLVFLTPHIVRGPDDLERISIRKREEFREKSRQVADLEEDGESANPVRLRLNEIRRQYPPERLEELDAAKEDEEQQRAAEAEAAARAPRYVVLVSAFEDELYASDTLTELLDAGFDGSLVSGNVDGFVTFEVRLGPFEDLSDAERTAEVMRSAYGFDPSILVERPEDL